MLDCFHRPSAYTQGAWPVDRALPMGTKLKCQYNRAIFHIPKEPKENYEFQVLEFDLTLPGAKHTCSATLGDGQIFFHSSKSFDVNVDLDSMPEARRHSWYAPPPERGESSEDKAYRQEENQEFLFSKGIALGYDVYFRVRGNAFEKVVKRVENHPCEKGFLKSVKHPNKGYVETQMRGYQVAPHLYFFPPVIKQARRGYKKVEFLKDMGENLADYIDRKCRTQGDLSLELKEALIQEVLSQYLEQLANKNIIHTDIKLMNVCIRECVDSNRSFDITFIDFDDAFISSSGVNDGSSPIEAGGSPGSIAPELFTTPLTAQEQRTLYLADPGAYEQRLKPDYAMGFCQKTDIYSLGVMLKQIGVAEQSRYHQLINMMLNVNPEERATVNDIRQLLDEPMSLCRKVL
ncbi:MAG: hypothetical protein P1U39_00375 [Legionellaceae bacterium]|nr:hypothetical protein [Legionellaceae bacterium]